MGKYWNVIREEEDGSVGFYCTYNDLDKAINRANALNENLPAFYTVVPFGWTDEEIVKYTISTSRLIFKSKSVTGKELRNLNREELIKLKRYIMKNYNV